ncbi:hypothetical protein TNCV_1832281 [Trichonephila clavipes]|nr:hypothetical protein TNCV_1832281 [Trichonephila clavipes]
MALDVWKEVSGVESMLRRCWCRSGHSSDCTIRDHLCSWDVEPPRRYTLSVIHCCQHRATTISLWRPIRLFDQPASLRLIIKSPSAARTAAGYVLEHLSLNIVYQSHQIRLDSRTALVLMLLNSPSCATNMRIAHIKLALKF